MTVQEAYPYAVAKFEQIVKNGGEALTSNQIMELNLSRFIFSCSYCELFVRGGCRKCPLLINGHSCSNFIHPYNNWKLKGTAESAQAVLDLIHKTKPKGA